MIAQRITKSIRLKQAEFLHIIQEQKRKVLLLELQKVANAQCGDMVISGPVVRNSEKWKNARTAR